MTFGRAPWREDGSMSVRRLPGRLRAFERMETATQIY